jgi:hypothetical protein
MKKVIGYYNEIEYKVFIIGESGLIKHLYNAGNSPLDSQQYVNAEDGIGLEKMKEYCEQTSKELAKENNLPFAGIEFEEYEYE